MARSSLRDAAGLPDPQFAYNFDLFFDDIPGGQGTDGRGLAIRCMSATLPGKQIEQVVVPLHGIEIPYGGRQIYNKTFSVVFHETRDSAIRNAIIGWINAYRNNQLNTGSSFSVISRTGEIVLYDDVPNETKRVRVFGCFPLNLDDLQLDGGQSAAVQYNVTFSYISTDE